MLAALLNLPKWLLVIIAISALGGQVGKLGFILPACDCAAVAHSTCGDDGGGESSLPGSHDSCSCQCHFGMIAAFETSSLRLVARSAQEADLKEHSDPAPDSPCADIEHPPQLA